MDKKSSPSHSSGHRERLRKRFLDAPEKLPEYELLELLLGYVLLRRDTKPLAKELLQKCGSLRGLLDARIEEIRQISGTGPGVEVFLLLLRELLARYAEGPLRSREILSTPEAVAEMARKRLGKSSSEEVWGAFVDNNNRLIAWKKMAQGLTESAFISPRTLVEQALHLNASGLILVHNHPGGTVKPSGADIELTNRVVSALRLVAVRFIDHVIVTDSQCYSLLSDELI